MENNELSELRSRVIRCESNVRESKKLSEMITQLTQDTQKDIDYIMNMLKHEIAMRTKNGK